MKKIAVLILIGLGLVLTMTSASGQTGGTYDLSWNAVPDGGQTFSAGGSFILGGTIAQPAAAAPMTGGTFNLSGGFWPAISPWDLYVPLVWK